jgi:tetratricopeptide (TPR) repeat protein
MLALAQRLQNPDFLPAARVAVGVTLLQLGKFTLAREYFDQGLVMFYAQEHHVWYGKTYEALCQVYEAWGLWLLGYPDQALQRSHEALSLAAHFYVVLADALLIAANVSLWRGKAQTAQEQAEQVIALATKHEFADLLARWTSVRGHALARQGRLEEGIVLMRQGSALQAAGGEAGQSFRLALLAEAYGKVGQTRKGWARWPKRSLWWRKLGSGGTRRSCINYAASLRSPSLVSRV